MWATAPPRMPLVPDAEALEILPARPAGALSFWRAHGFPASHIASQYSVKVNKPLPDCRVAHGSAHVCDDGGAGLRQVREEVSSKKGCQDLFRRETPR
jgi:hypothetical protein